MSKEEESVSETLLWAYHTIDAKLAFGMSENQAIYRRESRVKGVLLTEIPKVQDMETKIETLQSALDVLMEANEFYAQPNSWSISKASGLHYNVKDMIMDDTSKIKLPNGVKVSFGGKRAREAKQKVEEILNKNNNAR